jgi:hypothetical protein
MVFCVYQLFPRCLGSRITGKDAREMYSREKMRDTCAFSIPRELVLGKRCERYVFTGKDARDRFSWELVLGKDAREMYSREKMRDSYAFSIPRELILGKDARNHQKEAICTVCNGLVL